MRRASSKFVSTGLFAFALLCWSGWLVGRIVTDRFASLQFLHWIPTLLALLVTLTCAILLLWSKRRSMRQTLWALALVQVVVLASQDIAWRRPTAPDALRNQPLLRIAHFNANWPGKQSPRLADAIARGMAIAFRGEPLDVLFLSECGALLAGASIGTYAPADSVAMSIGRFGVISAVPIVEALPIFDDGKSTAALVMFAAWRGNPSFSALLVDLPSDPSLSRSEVLTRLRARLDAMQLPSPQLIVGDFNAARGGHSLRAFAPGMHHAFDEGGVGFGATYPRAWPLFHIDHMLLAPRVHARQYGCIDLGLGQHRMQAAIIQFQE